jgi:hypothetical protein
MPGRYSSPPPTTFVCRGETLSALFMQFKTSVACRECAAIDAPICTCRPHASGGQGRGIDSSVT